MVISRRHQYALKFAIVIILIFGSSNSVSQVNNSSNDSYFKKSSTPKIIYINPRVYNVDYSFELHPDTSIIDRDKDLKVWIPIPCEWESQKVAKIISVQPAPHNEYKDPEYGNNMLFWDFSKEPEKPSYKVQIRFRLESYEIQGEVDPEHIGRYDKKSKEYSIYTRSTHTIDITPKIKELAELAVGDEKNPYIKAEKIFKFVRQKMRYKIHRQDRGVGTKCLLDFSVIDKETGEEHYEGSCEQYSALFIALCRAAGIPARTVAGFIGWNPWIKEEDLKLTYNIDTTLSQYGLAAAQHYMALGLHTWAEFYIPNYGWIPADPQGGWFSNFHNYKLIISKGRDVKLGSQAPNKVSGGYGSQWIPINNGRVDLLRTGVFNILKIHKAKVKILHSSDPFPADGYAQYAQNLYPEKEKEEKIINWQKDMILSLLFYHINIERGDLNKSDIFEIYPWFNSSREAYLCHLLRQITGDKKFRNIFQTYLDLRLHSGKHISTKKFQEISESIHGASLDYFFNQWGNNASLAQFKMNNMIDTLYQLITQEDVASAVNQYTVLKDKHPDDYDFSKEQLNWLGVELRNTGLFDEAISIYTWIIEIYPDWWNAYNGIADVYRVRGDKKLAIKYYAKSLEMNPEMWYAVEISEVLKELTEQKDY